MEIIGIILLITAAGAVGFLVSVLTNMKLIPVEYLQPIYAVIIVITGYVWVLIVTAVIEKVVEPAIGLTRAHGIKNVIYLVAAIVIVVLVSTIFSFNLTGVLVGAGFAGIVLGLAAQQVLGNIFAGLSLLASKPFEIGDRITLGTASYSLMSESYSHEAMVNGFTGVVTDITIFFTKMDLDNGTPAVFPNSVVVGSMVINHSKVKSRTVRVRLDLDKRVDFTVFSRKFLESLEGFGDIDSKRSKVELTDIGSTTYQVLLEVWSTNSLEQPIKTVLIQIALKLQAEMNPGKTAESP